MIFLRLMVLIYYLRQFLAIEAFVHIFNKNYAFSENYKNDITENASMLIKLDDINSNLNVNVSNKMQF